MINATVLRVYCVFPLFPDQMCVEEDMVALSVLTRGW